MTASYGNRLFRDLIQPKKRNAAPNAPGVDAPSNDQGDNTSPDLKGFSEHTNAEMIGVAQDVANATSMANSMPGKAVAAALGALAGMPIGLGVAALGSVANSQTLGAVNGRFGTDYNDLNEAARDLGMRAAEHEAVGSDPGFAGIDAGLNDEAMGRAQANAVAGAQMMAQMEENDAQSSNAGSAGSSGPSGGEADGPDAGTPGGAGSEAWHKGGFIKPDSDGSVEDVPNQTLQEGEYVINRAAVNKIGKINLDKINNFPGDPAMLRRALERLLKN